MVDTSYTNESIPSSVLQTCLAMSTLGNMTISKSLITQNMLAYVAFYWAELDARVNASSRRFWVQLPNDLLYEDPFNSSGGLYMYDSWMAWDVPLTTSTSTTSSPEFVLYPDQYSTFGPSLNALEIYGETGLISLTTTEVDGEYSTSFKPI